MENTHTYIHTQTDKKQKQKQNPAICGSHSPLQLSLVHIPAPSLASCKYLYLDQNILFKYKTTTTNPGVIVWGPSHPKGRILGVGMVTNRFNELVSSFRRRMLYGKPSPSTEK